jgi:hypothetical protein
MKVPELDSRNKKLLIAGATLALGAAAFRTTKTGENITFDFSVWGDKTKRIFGDVIDDTKQRFGRIAGQLVLGPENEIIDVTDIEFSEGGAPPEARLEALEDAIADKEGWSGQLDS